MTDEQLAAIKQRVQAATPGPWRAEQHKRHGADTFIYSETDPIYRDDCYIASGLSRHADRDFIAHAREDVPVLLAEVRRLRKVCADVEGELPASCRVVNGDTKAIDLAASVATLERLRRGAIEMHLR